MATITKSGFIDIDTTLPRRTWTVSITGTNQTVSDDFTLITPVVTIKPVNYSSQSGYNFQGSSARIRLDLNIGKSFSYYKQGVNTSGTTYELPVTDSETSVDIHTIFNENNKYDKTVNIVASSRDKGPRSEASTEYYSTIGGGSYWRNYYTWPVPDGNPLVEADPYIWGIISTITLDAPPTYECSVLNKDTPDYRAGVTNVSIEISQATALYDGIVTNSSLTIGNQTVIGNGDGTLSMLLNSSGSFTPIVTVTDSRGQVTTKTLSEIIVNSYNIPSVNFNVYRSDLNGVKADEDHYAIIDAEITYTTGAATLVEPSVLINEVDASTNVTWYSNWNASAGVSNIINDWSSIASGSHVYGLIDGNFIDTISYQITTIAKDSLNKISAPITQTLSTAFYTIDFQAGGKEIAFGAPANEDLTDVNGKNYSNEGLFKCRMNTWFEQDLNVDKIINCKDVIISNLIGEIKIYAGATVPDGWLECDGSELNVEDYPLLFSAIGNTYGGDGITTFYLPDLRGRFPIGMGLGTVSDATSKTLGQAGGSERVTLDINQIPNHNHNVGLNAGGSSYGSGLSYATNSTYRSYADTGEMIGKTGGGQSHGNMPPYLAIKYIICAA